MRKFFNEFKKFITRGNVVDLAVAVIVGTAFNKIVSSLVADIITPLISLAIGKMDFSELVVILKPATESANALTLNYGVFIQYIIDFLIISFTIFIMVKVYSKVKNTMDFNLNMTKLVQEKIDNDEELTKIEKRWLKKFAKHNPELAPKKKVPTPPAPKVPTTNELLTEILNELKKEKQD